MKPQPLLTLAAAGLVTAQLSGKVGPTTSRDAKSAKKVCNVLSYGGVASATTDNSAALEKAWEACKAGGQVLIPSGSYGLGKSVSLAGGKGVSVNLEGVLFRISSATAAGALINVQAADDFELYSGNSKGAIQGYGYELHKDGKTGPGLVKISNSINFSVHGVALVDSPASHLTLEGATNAEVYNVIAYGGNTAGVEGIAVSGKNNWVHDVEVSNGEHSDCVAVKSPSSSIQIESVFCNLSGGSTIGPLGFETSVRDIQFQNVYSQRCHHMAAVKANGGSGPAREIIFQNFTGHGNVHGIKLDAQYKNAPVAQGDGVEFDGISFSNWAGSTIDGAGVPSIQLHCLPTTLCGSLVVEDYNVGTETGAQELYECRNSYGMGACMNPYAGNGAYTTTMTVKTFAAEKTAVPKMPSEATKALGITASIDIPAVPTTFYPGLKPVSTLLGKA